MEDGSMNVTIKEASEMFCPFKFSMKLDVTKHEEMPIYFIPNCNGDLCMLWRWDNKNKREEHNTGHCGMIRNFVSKV